MPRAPLPPLVLGARTIPLAYPPLVLRTALLRAWSDATPQGGEAPQVAQHTLLMAGVGLAWEAAHRAAMTPPMGGPPVMLAACGRDLFRFGEAIGDAFDAGEPVDSVALIVQADAVVGALFASITVSPEKAKAAEDTAVFSAAEPVPGSAPGSAQPTAGSAPPSPGTV
jgi:hypothetical protein